MNGENHTKKYKKITIFLNPKKYDSLEGLTNFTMNKWENAFISFQPAL